MKGKFARCFAAIAAGAAAANPICQILAAHNALLPQAVPGLVLGCVILCGREFAQPDARARITVDLLGPRGKRSVCGWLMGVP